MPIQSKQQPPYYQPGRQIDKYKALLIQEATNAPTVTILENTLNGTPVWTRVAKGIYRATLTDAFPTTKTIALPFGQSDFGIIQMGIGSSLPFDYAFAVTTPNKDYIQLNVFKQSDYSDEDISEILNISQKILINIEIYNYV